MSETFLLVFLTLFLVFACLLLFVIASAFFGFVRTRVPFVPTANDDVKFIARALGITDKDIVYELGSGNGRVCFGIAQLTGAKCVGFELTTWTHLWAVLKLRIQNLKPKKKMSVEFRRENFFNADWSESSVIYGYLYPPLMHRVKEKFLQECKPGTKAIMRDFFLPGLTPLKVFERADDHQIYLYVR